jgi:hypothetical protein
MPTQIDYSAKNAQLWLSQASCSDFACGHSKSSEMPGAPVKGAGELATTLVKKPFDRKLNDA